MLKIEHLLIEDINGIKDIYIKFNPGINIICGPNGIGKTTILNCIRNSFRIRNRELKASANSQSGNWNIFINKNGSKFDKSFTLYNKGNNYYSYNVFNDEYYDNKNHIRTNEVIHFNVENRFTTNSFTGIRKMDRIKEWIVMNYYMDKDINYNKFHNIELIKECFYRIDPLVSFGRIVEKTDENYVNYKSSSAVKTKLNKIEIMVDTPHGEIPLKSLSSGYISCINILLGIIREVEVKGEFLEDFYGIILIDELDLHLHPEWQSKLISIVKWLVPNAQIIATTHSPHIIQTSKAEEIIALERDVFNNNPIIRKAPASSEYGYQGWTIEEILIDVMGLKNPMSETFLSVLENFEKAQREKNILEIKENYLKLKKMLHPRNPLLKILSIQSGEINIWEGLHND
jgi:predicted ATP-binding protein involved in virulence